MSSLRAKISQVTTKKVPVLALVVVAMFGMVAGVLGCMSEYLLYRLGVIAYRTPMAATLNLAIWGGASGLVTAVVVSLFTKPRPEHELAGLVFNHSSDTAQGPKVAWFRTPAFLAALVAAAYVALNIVFR